MRDGRRLAEGLPEEEGESVSTSDRLIVMNERAHRLPYACFFLLIILHDAGLTLSPPILSYLITAVETAAEAAAGRVMQDV